MPPKKGKGKKAAAAAPAAPAEPKRRSGRGKAQAATTPEPEVPVTADTPAADEAEPAASEALKELLPPTASDVAQAVETVLSAPAVDDEPAPDTPMAVDEPEPVATEPSESLPDVEMGATGSISVVPPPPTAPSMTMEQRQAKLAALRSKMQSAANSNREDVIEEHQKQKTSARELARLEKQRALAATLREKADAEEMGVDTERKKNWEWTIEENDAWEKKLKRKKRRADFEFHDEADEAQKRYKKDLNALNPDLAAYQRQKEQALGLVPGALSVAGSSKSGGVITSATASSLAAADLYRDANTLTYGDNKPTDDAIDRVVSKINMDIDKKGKFSRRRTNEDDGDITYINEHNKVFNKKIARYYDKYTKDIRDSFERGTAL